MNGNIDGFHSKKYGNRMRAGCFYRFPALILLFLLIFFICFTSCTKVNKAFLNQALTDFDSSSYFIALNVKSPEYRGRAIIENNNLYGFLHKTKGLNKKEYQSFVIRLLHHKRSLKMSDRDFEEWKFSRVQEIEKVIEIANRGRNGFVEYYFDGFMLNYGITDKERNAIINQLFYWAIPAKIGKETGNLMIG